MRKEERQWMELDLGKLLRALAANLPDLVAAALLGAAVTLAATVLLVSPKYQSSVMFYVNNKTPEEGGISNNDLTTSRSLVNSYIVLLNTGDTLADVIQASGTGYTPKQLKGMLQSEAADGTELFRILVTAKSAAEAERIADAISRILPEKIASVMEGATAKVVDPAVAAAEPFSPHYVTNGFLGGICGLVLAVAVVFLQEGMDGKIRREQDLAVCCDCPVLAKRSSENSELRNCLTLAVKLDYLLKSQEFGSVIGICWEEPRTMMRLANAMTRLGKKAVVIMRDANPNAGEGIPVVCMDGLQAGERCGRLNLEPLRQKYDYIFLSLPERISGEMLLLASQTDGILLAAVQNQSKIRQQRDLAQQLTSVGARLLGTIYQETGIRAHGRRKPRYLGRYLKKRA